MCLRIQYNTHNQHTTFDLFSFVLFTAFYYQVHLSSIRVEKFVKWHKIERSSNVVSLYRAHDNQNVMIVQTELKQIKQSLI